MEDGTITDLIVISITEVTIMAIRSLMATTITARSLAMAITRPELDTREQHRSHNSITV
jgi:hypothetical protein